MAAHLEEYLNSVLPRFVHDSTHVACSRQFGAQFKESQLYSARIGHMTGSLPHYVPPLAELVTAMNQNVVKTETSKTVTLLEKQVTASIHRLIYNRSSAFYEKMLQDTDQTMGMFTSGGTIANITGLWVARNVALGPDPDRNFAGVEKCGMMRAGLHYGYCGAAIIGSALLHYSLKKAADVLGLGVDGMITCSYDANYQVIIEEVESRLQECAANNICVIALVGIAGATETGSVDDLQALAELAKSYGTHFHVDAAWGGPCLFSRTLSPMLRGIESADSVTIDGHKQLFMPMGSGMLLLRDPEKSNMVSKTASYIIRQGSSDLGRFTLEGSRPGAAIYMHANLSCIGARGYEALMDRSVRVCRYMAQALRSMRSGTFEVLFEPMINILLYRYVPQRLRSRLSCEKGRTQLSEEDWRELDEANASLQDRQKAEGRTFVSRTSVLDVRHGRRLVALRVVIGNPLTEESDIDEVIADQLRITGDCDLAPQIHRSRSCLQEGDERAEYWRKYWDRMPEAARLFFLNNSERFRASLVAPYARSVLDECPELE
ncbi:unnamed protein product [Polarella glacialis]|uniref:Glutamate decarboxylase n=4 Tax=Polarella glacialis TaxID=89957 RepID=A0A813DCV2_POLGL|nr:unnamed protein product [Polarella glacialis]